MVRINDVPQPDDPRRIQRSENRRAQEARREAQSESAGESDSVALSSDARRAQAVEARLSEAAQAVPDVREDRVAQARARLEAGEFDREEVRQAIADRLLEQFGI